MGERQCPAKSSTVSPWAHHIHTQGMEGTPGTPNSHSPSTKDELALLTSPGYSLYSNKALGRQQNSALQQNRVPELNPALQCHLWGAAHCSASCTVPGEPGSSSVPTSHPAPSHSTAGRAGAEQRNTRHCWAWQPDVYLSWQSTLCPTRSPNPNVGRTPRGCQKQQEAPNVPVLCWPARDSSSSSAHQSPELVLGSGGQTPAAAAAGETGNVCRKC